MSARRARLNAAISQLAKMMPYGELQASTDPAAFLDAVAADLTRLRKSEARLVDATKGLLREEPNIYEGRLEASLYVTVDALEEARAAIDAADGIVTLGDAGAAP